MSTQEHDVAPTQRRLIRPNLAELKDRYPTRSFQRKQAPAEQTNAENYYYLKQMASKTPMVVVLNDGEQLHGWIEWYDKACIKLNRHREPNLLVPKHSIKYMFKESDEDERELGGNR
jgi:host factor-I protein